MRTARIFQIGIIAGGSAVYSLAQWLMLLLFARETSMTEMGAYSYAMSVSAPFFIFSALSLRQVYVSDPQRGSNWRKYLKLRIVSTIVALIVTCLFALMNQTFNGIFLFVSLIKSVDLIGDIWLAPAQSAGRTRALGLYQFINGTVSLSLFSLGIFFGMPATYALAMSLLGSIVATSFSLIVGRKSIKDPSSAPAEKTKPKNSDIVRLAATAAPLGIAGFLNSATEAAPGYFLERTDGLESVGIFSAMVYLLLVGNTVVSAIVQFELPRSVAHFQKNGRAAMLKRTRGLSFKMAGLGLIAVLLTLAIGETVMQLLYGPEYRNRIVLVLLAISWAVGAISWMWDLALVVQRSFNVQLIASIVGLSFSAGASVLLIGPYGLLGAGISALVARIAVAIVRLIGLIIETGHRPKHRLSRNRMAWK
ncbi:oligosaccharide flippase family protein [Corynebacterium sp. H127]|uniref:lipopolysaccharide biosynthesis protein n=1 Tax=Corynebacterium sp. H127 TaxID=3133418 RepID=UPI0030A97B73